MKVPILQAIQGTENIDCALAVWENMIMAVLQHRVPTREIRIKSQRKMWMTSELYHLSKRKFRLFNIARSTRSADDWSKYARFRNFCTSRFQSAKENFLRRKHEEISSATDGSHRWWTLAKKLARITTPRDAIPKLCTAEHTATTDLDKACNRNPESRQKLCGAHRWYRAAVV